MTTETKALPDLDPALDFEVPCDWSDGCKDSVAWSVVNTCCGQTGLLCMPHAVEYRIYLSTYSVMPYRLHCNPCGAVSPDIKWEPIR